MSRSCLYLAEAAIEGVQASVDPLKLLSGGWCLKIEIMISNGAAVDWTPNKTASQLPRAASNIWCQTVDVVKVVLQLRTPQLLY